MNHAPVLVIAVLLGGSVGCGGGQGREPKVVTTARPTITYEMPSSSMEPTLHCARPGQGCEAAFADAVVVEPVDESDLRRRDIVAFRTPPLAKVRCGAGDTFIKRIIGLPGETVSERVGGLIYVNGKKLDESSYLSAERRREDLTVLAWHVPRGQYFMMGDNRGSSCDSRVWGAVPAPNILGRVTKILRPD